MARCGQSAAKQKEGRVMNTRYPPVPQIFGARPIFKYSAPWTECRIIHEHDCMGDRLLVVGDPDNGCYEWVILTTGKVESHSDCGHGISEVALRDGLIAAFKDCFTEDAAAPAIATPALRTEMEERARQILEKHLEPQESDQPAAPAGPFSSIVPAAGRHAHLWDGSDLSPQPTAESRADTSPAATHAVATGPHVSASAASSAPDSNPPLHVHTRDSTAHSEAMAPHAPTTTCAAGAHHAGSPQASAPGASSTDSSAQPGEACGDINCDGLNCRPIS
jgi:hypothetical protein